MRIRHWFGFQGTVTRSTYAIVGIFGVLLKHNLDRLLALKLLHQPWTVWSYLFPLGIVHNPNTLLQDQKKFLLILALTAIPFIWIGIVMTVKRLRDAGLNTLLVLIFFAPVLNVVFFIFLCAVPSREQAATIRKHPASLLSAILPKSQAGIATFSGAAAALAGCGMGWILIKTSGNYGWTLFLAIPFFMGFLAVWLYIHQQPRSFGQCAGVAMLSVVLAGAFLVGIALDGLICVLLAAPIAAALALLGAGVAYVLRSFYRAEAQSSVVLSLFFAIPFFASAEFLAPLPTPVYHTRTTIEISAPPQVVWKRIISFPHIDAPPNPLFRLGFSYPLEARIAGTGLTADRQCIFSSGAFREPILAWEEGKHFAFGVSEEPLLMKELSPYRELHVRHLDDHDFRPQRGDFYLTELPGGRTRLDGWTTYENRMWPGAYWRICTDIIVHQIHLRVFGHIKELAEADVRLGASHGSLP